MYITKNININNITVGFSPILHCSVEPMRLLLVVYFVVQSNRLRFTDNSIVNPDPNHDTI